MEQSAMLSSRSSASARLATVRGSLGNGSLVSASAMEQIMPRVGCSQKGSGRAVAMSGMATRSPPSTRAKPGMEDPSKPTPLRSSRSLMRPAGMVT